MKKVTLLVIAAVAVLITFAQKDIVQKKDTTMAVKVKYNCPMHPEVTSNKPGKCSKCGMNLVKTKTETVKMYSCPMHPEEVSNKPGKCPKCGMALTEVKTKTKKG